MIIDEKIVVQNYKCFDSIGGGFEKIYPINIIIGKNNSGKSSLIDLIKFVIEGKEDFMSGGRDGSNPEVLISFKLTKDYIIRVFKNYYGDSDLGLDNRYRLVGKLYTYKKVYKDQNRYSHIDADIRKDETSPLYSLTEFIESPFKDKLFCNITAERDIVPEISNSKITLSPNGTGATNYIQQILNRTNKDSLLIENELLKELNNIVNPDIKFTRILVQQRDDDKWELFFEDYHRKRIALSKMGSGIKTILLVLLNLIVRPKIENKEKYSYVFAFEELENNLHPSLQRRLYNYIIAYSEANINNKVYFFLTTHSNVVIDAFGTNENAQLLHVENDGNKSTVNTILSSIHTKKAIHDLGIKASDILQSNGVIWVEGPSDRNYLNKWLGILAPDLKEGLHYSIMFYGGRLLANLSFDWEWFNKEVIPLLKINTNAFVVIDRDGKTPIARLNDTKIRINNEIGDNNCWITKGREIENYLSDLTISRWLKDKHGFESSFNNDKNCKIEENISKSNDKIKLQYNLSKTLYSAEIVDYINKDSMDVLDLKVRLEVLIKRIREWNHDTI